jgi:hypothetical protein
MPGADKETIVHEASGFTTSLSEFAQADIASYWRMIADMERAVSRKVDESTCVENVEKEQKRLRSAILHRLQKHGVNTTDWKAVNTFMSRPQVSGKMLFEMSIDEMKAFVTKMHAILDKDKQRQDAEKKKVLSN